jgi:hypothetical protein
LARTAGPVANTAELRRFCDFLAERLHPLYDVVIQALPALPPAPMRYFRSGLPEATASTQPIHRLAWAVYNCLLCTLLHRLPDCRHGRAERASIGSLDGDIPMTNWQSDLNALIAETKAFTEMVDTEQTMPRPNGRLNRAAQINSIKSERDEICQRVANFRAHQQRFIREREDYAAAELKRMWSR